VENKENLSQDNQQLGLDLNCVTLKYNVVKGQWRKHETMERGNTAYFKVLFQHLPLVKKPMKNLNGE